MCFCILCRISRWLPKMAGKRFFGKSWPVHSTDTLRPKILSKSLYCTISKINVVFFCVFCQKWREYDFWESRQFPWPISCLPSMQKFKMVTKMAGKQFLGTSMSSLNRYPGGSKNSPTWLYLALFQRQMCFGVYAEVQDIPPKWRRGLVAFFFPQVVAVLKMLAVAQVLVLGSDASFSVCKSL